MCNWLVMGPIKMSHDDKQPNESHQKEFFDHDPLSIVKIVSGQPVAPERIEGREYPWVSTGCKNGLIDFNALIGNHNYATAYALAEIKMESPTKALVGVGSDDDIKIFLNGNLVHSNWTCRTTLPDNDLVMLDLKQGSNQLLVKVQNIEGGWSFAIRKPGKAQLDSLIMDAAQKGILDDVKILAENGANVNVTHQSGLTPYLNASIHGRKKIMDLLKDKGADTLVPTPHIETLIDDIFRSVQKGKVPGVAVLVSKDGRVIYEKGFGYANLEKKIPITPGTKFRIGSITKQFTASGILRLQEEGKLSVNDKLSKFFPDFPRGDEVTILHLLNHTSGIHSFTNQPNFEQFAVNAISSKALADTIKAGPFDFNPGEKNLYNNSGYVLLGFIIEQVSGLTLEEFFEKTFFQPLGMHHTGVYRNERKPDHEAIGYTFNKKQVVTAPDWNMSWAGGAGSLYSTVHDLNRWNEALFNGKVLSDSSMQAAFSPTVLNNHKEINYGFGWSLDTFRDLKFISHGGGVSGFVSYLLRQPESKLTVIVLCNATPPPGNLNPGGNSFSIAELLLWQLMGQQGCITSNLASNPSVLKEYTGRYDYGNGAVLLVTEQNNQLNAQLTGQMMFPIFPSGTDEFSWKVVDAKVRFLKNSNGEVISAMHSQGGQQFEAKKLPVEMPVNINPMILTRYTGKYDMGNKNQIEVLKEGNNLILQLPGLPKYMFFPSSENEFFAHEVSLRITFHANNGEIADSLTIQHHAIQKTAKRVQY